LEFAVDVTESLGLLISPGGVVFGIKVEDDVFALEIFQSDFVALCVEQGECRRGLTFLDSHIYLLLLGFFPIRPYFLSNPSVIRCGLQICGTASSKRLPVAGNSVIFCTRIRSDVRDNNYLYRI
jgi:hypothetical protein